MDHIIRIDESPLALHSMRVIEFQTDPSASPMSDIFVNERTPHVTADQVRRAFEYYALDAADRTPAAYEQGCLHIVHVVRDLYNSLMEDNTWTERSKTLFEAVNCGNIVKVTRLEGKSRQADLNKKGKSPNVAATNLVVVHVKANAKLYWDRERELHAFAVENDGAVKFTSADPGPFSEYERRFIEAAEYDNLGNTDVVVRYLDVSRGEAVEERVRVYQLFVLESGAQLTLVQALYEICVWHYSMQAKSLEDWRKVKDKDLFAEQWAEKMNKKLRVVRLLSKLQIIPSRESTSKKMDGTTMTTQSEKKTKKPSKFERFYAAMKKEGSQTTRVKLKEFFDQMPLEEKEKYGNPDAKKTSVARPQNKVPEIVVPPPPEASRDDKSDDEFFSDDDADDDGDYDVNDPDDGERGLVELADDEDQDRDKPSKKSDVAEPEASKKRKVETTEAPPSKVQKVGVVTTTQKDGQKKMSTNTAKASSSKPLTTTVLKPTKAPENPKKAQPQKKEKIQKIIGKEIVHDLVESERVHFLWELLSQNMNAMVEAKRPFTSFENTPFEDAFKVFSDGEGKTNDEGFRSAKKVLSQTPGIKLCFQMFNLLFGKEKKIEDDVDDLIFG